MEHGGLLQQVTVVYENQLLSLRAGGGNDIVNVIVKEVTSFIDNALNISRSVWPTAHNAENSSIGSHSSDDVDVATNGLQYSSISVRNSPNFAMLVQNTEVIITPKRRSKKQQLSWSTPLQLVPTDEDWGSAFELISGYSEVDQLQTSPGCIVISDEIWHVDVEWALIKKATVQRTAERPDQQSRETILVRVVRSSTISSRKAGKDKCGKKLNFFLPRLIVDLYGPTLMKNE